MATPTRAFRDRAEAGQVLARLLAHYRGRPDVLVFGLPRGGVPVAAEVAAGLGATLDVFVVRKLGVPGHEELAMGAIASGGVRVVNRTVVDALGIEPDVIESVATRELKELERRDAAYRGARPLPEVANKVVIVVDDGLATGSTMRAAVSALRTQQPSRIVVAVPVGSEATCDQLEKEADEVICARMPAHFFAVGQWYHDFSPTTDEQIRALLSE